MLCHSASPGASNRPERPNTGPESGGPYNHPGGDCRKEPDRGREKHPQKKQGHDKSRPADEHQPLEVKEEGSPA